MLKIDAHQHFWKYDPVRYNWLTDEMAVIKKDFLPENLFPLLKQNKLDGCVVVQCNQSENENNFLLEFAEKNDFIKGVVGWIDLQHRNVEQQLEYNKQFDKLKGFRHILQSENNRALMLEPAFKKSIGLLKKFNFTYDILIFSDQLKYVHELVKMFPEQKFVIDHLAKPSIKNQKITDWKNDIEKLKPFENVYCKISGMVTEADWNNCTTKVFKPYLDVIIETFGVKKIMYGSDWPVCLVAASYNEVINICKEYFSTFTKNEQDLFFGGNAIAFYNLN